jgi:DNA topoisomerase-2
MSKSRTITSIIHGEHREASKYVCYHRAIPALVDGFKPSQRKAFYVLRNKKDFVKVQAVSGMMISDANYHHGDSAASEAVSKMAQDFPGSNNVKVFAGKGAFGSRFIKEPSAPRYIFVKPNRRFYDLFKDDVLCEPDDDIENPEPRFYLPVIPTLLLNGVEGIAVGFACKIQPYSIGNVVMNVRQALLGDRQVRMVPHFEGYTGEVSWDEKAEKFVQYGRFKVVNTTTIKILEVPTHYDREKYHRYLDGLESKGLIRSYMDESKTGWDITVRLVRKSKVFEDPMKVLGLKAALNENITLIDPDGNLRVYESPNEVISEFVRYRLGVYRRRIEHELETIKEDVFLAQAKAKFIVEMGKFDFRKTARKTLREHFLGEMGFRDDHLEKCLAMPITRLNRESLADLKAKLTDLKARWNYYRKVTPEELYEIDLENVK